MKRLNDRKKDDKAIFRDIETLGEEYSTDNTLKLINYFGHPQWAIRKKAAETVVNFGQKIVSALSQTIFLDYNVDEDTLYWCIHCAGNIGGGAVKTILLPLLDHDGLPKDFRIFVVRALHKIDNDPEIIDILIKLLSDPSWNVRKEAAEILQGYGENIIPQLKKAFSSGNKDIRYWTVKILGHIMGTNAINFFETMLKSLNKDIRYYAVAALGEIDHEDSLKVLSDYFNDESWLVRAQISEIFERRGEKSIKFLKKIFEKGNSDSRYQTIKLMGKIMNSEAMHFIETILNSRETEMKFYALTALSETNDKNSIPLIIEALKDDVWLIRKHASETLAKMGDKIIPVLEKLFSSGDDNLLYWSIITLSNMGDSGVTLLKKYYYDLKKKEKKLVLENLKNLQNTDVLNLLFDALEDKDWPVRSTSANKIMEDINGIETILIDKYVSGNDDMKFWIIKIIQANSDKMIPFLRKNLKTVEIPSIEELQLKANSLIILFSLNTEDTIDLLSSQLKETNEDSEYLLEVLAKTQINPSLFEVFLDTYFTQDDNIKHKIHNLLIENLYNFPKILRKKINDNFIIYSGIFDLILENKNSKTLKFLEKFLDIKQIDIKCKIFQSILSFETLESILILLKYYKNCNEEEKLVIISTKLGKINKNCIKAIIDQFRVLNNEESKWNAKLLVAWGGDDFIPYFHSLQSSISDPKIKEWLGKVIEHISGKQFIE